jgi:redox-regulated HSP33 family molecular chaperone
VDQGGGIYIPRVDNGSFRKYQYLNNQWMITEKDGSVYQLGATAQARQDHPTDTSKVFTWMLESVTDTNGNTITYTYYKDQGQIYPATITYADGLFVVSFIRAARAQTSTSYLPGYKVVNAQYISEVTVTSEGSLTTSYDITRTGNLVTDIQVAGHEGGTSFELPAVGFEYEQSITPGWSTTLNTILTTSYKDGTNFTDVNGDGLVDLVIGYVKSDGNTRNYTYLNNSNNSWVYSTEYTLAQGYWIYNANTKKGQNFHFSDVNGDGLVDITKIESTLASQFNTGSGWSTTLNTILTTSYKDGTNFTDVNGDGLVDLVIGYVKSDGNTRNYTYLNNSNNSWVYSTEYTLAQGYWIYNANTKKGQNFHFSDVNGDGLVDITKIESTLASQFNTGSGWSTTLNTILTTSYKDGTNFTDVNGDGLVDLVIGYVKSDGNTRNYTYLNNSNNSWVYSTEYTLAQGYWIYNANTKKGQNFHFSDVNGDGLVDITKIESTLASQFNTGNNVTLSKITSPTQGETNITYTTARIQDASNKVPFTLDVIDSITTNDKEGNLATTTYGYRNASYYYNTPYDKKFAGFGTVIKTNPDGSVVTTKYHQANGQQGNEPTDSYAKIGKAYEQTLTQSGATYTKTRTNYVETRGTNAQSINVSSELTRTYDGGANSIVDTATGYSYDSYGNVLTETQYGTVNGSDDGSFSDSGSDKRTTTSTYTNDTVNYIVGLPTNQTLTDASGTKASETIYTYNPQGNLLNRSLWIAGNNYQDTSYTYNPQGNITSETDALLNTTSYGYNSTTLYPTSSTNALGQTTSMDMISLQVNLPQLLILQVNKPCTITMVLIV